MNSSETHPLRLEIRGLGHIQSFKNKKRAIMNQVGKMQTVTARKTKSHMAAIIQLITSQLCSAYQTMCIGTQMGLSLPSWIALSLPLDDSVHWIKEITLRVEKVQPGEEGAEIFINQICH